MLRSEGKTAIELVQDDSFSFTSCHSDFDLPIGPATIEKFEEYRRPTTARVDAQTTRATQLC